LLKAKSLYHLIVYSIFFIIILISFFTFIIINNAHEELQEKITTLKEDYTNNQKALLKNYVNYVVKFIDYYYIENRDKFDEETIQKNLILALDHLNISSNPNEYIFIFDINGNLIDNSNDKQEIGKNFLNYKDSKGKSVVKELIEASKNSDGGFVNYFWSKPSLTKETNKISYVKSYDRWSWTIGKGVYLDEIDRLIKQKEEEYSSKISNYTLQITSLTILLILYSIFIYKNATILIVNDVKEIGKYFKESEERNEPINQNRITLGEFKIIANYANDTMTNIKLKSSMLEELNKNLEIKVNEKTKELSDLVESQKQFLKNSVHEINTPLAIIRTNIDLLKMKIPENKYITNIESGSKTIQYIYDDLSYLIKKDRVLYEKEYLEFSEILKNRLQNSENPDAKHLYSLADHLVHRAVWLIGGDGWAYDIGSGGLDHALSTGRNINVLVLDTEVYSNTGGQSSKATPTAASAKFATAGKRVGKKDLAMQAISYGNVYVATVAMGANPQQTLLAMREAEAYDGPSLILAYSHCIAHGIDMEKGLNQQKMAVASGYWPLIRFNPVLRKNNKNPFILDSIRPTIPFEEYAYNELRYRVLKQTQPQDAEHLMKLAQEIVDLRWKTYEDMASLGAENFQPTF